MKVVITEAAWSDMLRIGRTIQADNPKRAETFLDELHHCCVTLADMPKAYPIIPRYEKAGIRRRVHGNYLVFYRFADERIEVLHVLHGAQDYESILPPEE